MFRILMFSFLIMASSSCSESGEQKASEAGIVAKEGGIADIIRNPVTAGDNELDTSRVAKLVFTESAYDFGQVDEGAVISHTFQFSNGGAVPLIISDVRSTCGCTVADWPKEPILPGEGAEIPVRFDTKNKNGQQNKPITITANTLPAKSVIYLNGRVDGKAD